MVDGIDMANFCIQTCKIENLRKFGSVGHALSYFNRANPARYKAFNPFEPDRGHKPHFEDFTGGSPSDTWARVCGCVNRVLRSESHEAKYCFVMRNFGPRESHLSVAEIAKRLKTSKRSVYRYLERTSEAIRQEMIRQELLEPEIK